MKRINLFSIKYLVAALSGILLLLYTPDVSAQGKGFIHPSDTFNNKRFLLLSGLTGASYAASFAGLGIVWYSQYPKSGFHLFNDAGEWRNMDKYGHAFSGHATANLLYNGAKWAGVPEKTAIWSATGVSFGGLLTLEILDGFSAEWGFSVSDLAFNTIGAATFALQQALWHDQRIIPKWTSYPTAYPDFVVYSDNGVPMNIRTRAEDLFGTSLAERVAKDYNASIFWLSANIHSFFPTSRVPAWLNVAVGTGAQNMLGGYSNEWVKGGEHFIVPDNVLSRYNQYYIGLDVDLGRIPVRNPYLKTVFGILRHIKIPLPGLEFTSQGKVIFHPVLF